eukprot:1133922-Rhodomonas_salina.1
MIEGDTFLGRICTGYPPAPRSDAPMPILHDVRYSLRVCAVVCPVLTSQHALAVLCAVLPTVQCALLPPMQLRSAEWEGARA